MSRGYGVNGDLISVSVYGPHKGLGHHKGISLPPSQENPTVNLTATYNFEHYSVDNNGKKLKITN